MEEKSNKELWEDIERQELERALDSTLGSDERKQALKQAADANEILEKETKLEYEKKEARTKRIWDVVKCIGGGVAAVAVKLYFTSREEQHENAKIDRVMEWEEAGQMPSHTPSKNILNNAFKRR